MLICNEDAILMAAEYLLWVVIWICFGLVRRFIFVFIENPPTNPFKKICRWIYDREFFVAP